MLKAEEYVIRRRGHDEYARNVLPSVSHRLCDNSPLHSDASRIASAAAVGQRVVADARACVYKFPLMK
jgi:hypothetical protein